MKNLLLIIAFLGMASQLFSQEDSIGQISFMQSVRGNMYMMSEYVTIDKKYNDIIFPLSGTTTKQKAQFRSSKKQVLLDIIKEFEATEVSDGDKKYIEASTKLTTNFISFVIGKKYGSLKGHKLSCYATSVSSKGKTVKFIIMEVPAVEDWTVKAANLEAHSIYFSSDNLKNLKAVLDKIP